MEQIWKRIQHDVEKKNWNRDSSEGLHELFDKGLDVILSKYPVKGKTIERNGDIVVGFYLEEGAAKERMALALSIGGVDLPSLDIAPGEFVYALEGTHVYPMIAVAYSEMHIHAEDMDGLYVIYGVIGESSVRRELATNGNVLRFASGTIANVRGGCFGYVRACESEGANEIPPMV